MKNDVFCDLLIWIRDKVQKKMILVYSDHATERKVELWGLQCFCVSSFRLNLSWARWNYNCITTRPFLYTFSIMPFKGATNFNKYFQSLWSVMSSAFYTRKCRHWFNARSNSGLSANDTSCETLTQNAFIQVKQKHSHGYPVNMLPACTSPQSQIWGTFEAEVPPYLTNMRGRYATYHWWGHGYIGASPLVHRCCSASQNKRKCSRQESEWSTARFSN